MRKLFKKVLWLVVFVFVALLGGYWLVRTHIEGTTRGHIYQTVGEVPNEPVALVLGAQVFPDKVPSPALAYRLETAVSLYKQGKVNKLLMSGDGRSRYYDEVATMKEYALKAGVPSADILIDEVGLRTYTSCYRARNEFNLTRLVVVTQPEHLLRTVYTCRSLGIDAVGLAAPEIGVGDLTSSGYWQYYLREKAALVLAWLDVEFIHPTP